VNACVLTVSDGVFHGTRPDASGSALAELLRAAGYELVETAVVADEVDSIRRAVSAWCEEEAGIALVLVTGGTGFAPRDVTPEALSDLYERDAPGVDEAIRADAMRTKPNGMLTRGRSGVRGRTLVISFPGSPNACREGFAVVEPILEHALKLLRERPTEHL
jgi:molybdopterin adenylyltransferase